MLKYSYRQAASKKSVSLHFLYYLFNESNSLNTGFIDSCIIMPADELLIVYFPYQKSGCGENLRLKEGNKENIKKEKEK